MYSILHITDLHRAKNDPISNSELLSALISDRECYEREDPPIRPPDAIVVSGDVIQGVPLHHADFESELAAQYGVAHDFLVSLADRFLNGDRTKVIIVPGNHDIDWNVAFSSMVPVEDKDLPSNIPVALFECGFHAIRPHSPRSSGRAFHAHLAICSTTIRTGSRSAATQGWHCYSEVPGVVNLFARLRIDSPLRLIR